MRYVLTAFAFAVAVLGDAQCILTFQVVSNSGIPLPAARFQVSQLEANGNLRRINGWKQGQPLPYGHYEITVNSDGFRDEVVRLDLESDELAVEVGLRLGSVGNNWNTAGQWFDRGVLPDECDRISLVPRFSPSAPRISARLRLKGKTYVDGLLGGFHLVIAESRDRVCALELHNVGYGKSGISITLGEQGRQQRR